MVDVRNIHVRMINDEVLSFKTNTHRSPAGSLTHVDEHEVGRWKTFTKETRSVVEWANKPVLDLPKQHPKVVDTPTIGTLPRVTNPFVNNMVLLWETFQVELLKGQSNDQSSGFHPANYGRLVALLDQMNSYIVDVVEKNTPLDLPDVTEKPIPTS